jgi:hypothetical protein
LEKVLSWREPRKQLSVKNFAKGSDGRWKAAKTTPGGRLSMLDTVVDIGDTCIDGMSAEQVTKVISEAKGETVTVRVHRQAKNRKEMYSVLRMPPPSTKITLWDMDLCMLKVHTGGHTNEKLQVLSKQVTEAYCFIMDRMIEAKRTIGVVTFSDKLVARALDSQYGGEDLVRPLVFHALRRHWMAQDRSFKLEDAIKKARSFVENDLYVRAAFPDWRNKNVSEFKKSNMPNNKSWHMERVKEDVKAKAGITIKNQEMILFDDGRKNVEDAIKAKVAGVLVNEQLGFSVKDWNSAMDIAWEYHTTGNFNA